MIRLPTILLLSSIATSALAQANGPYLTSGNKPPVSSVGLNNNYYLDYATGNFYGPKDIGVWPQAPIASFTINGISTDGSGVAGQLAQFSSPHSVIGADWISATSTNFTVSLGKGGVLSSCTTCDSTVAIGYEAGQSWIDGRSSTFVGHVAGQWAQHGSSNTFIGAYSGRGGSGFAASPQLSGVDNTCMGEASCLNIHGTASYNVGLGFNALYGLTTGISNTAIGTGAGQSLTDGNGNVIVGQNAYQFGMGTNNVIIGRSAGVGTAPSSQVTSGSAAGTSILYFTDTSIYHVGDTVFFCCAPVGSQITSVDPNVSITINNVLFGDVPVGASVYSIPSPHTGQNAVIIGYNASTNIQGTNSVIAIGTNAAQNLTTGTNNLAIGRNALSSITTQTSNVAIGPFAGNNVTSVNNTFLGASSGQGVSGTPLTGTSNTGVGQSSLSNIQGSASSNAAFGSSAGIAITTASTTTALGSQSLLGHQTGNGSVGVGFQSLSADVSGTGNIGLGYQSGSSITTGSFNLNLGYSVGSTTLTTGSRNILIGTSANCATDASGTTDQFKVCASNGATPLLVGNLTQGSLAITVNGAPTLSAVPASAGSGGLYLCIDSSGVLYKSASCP
jgi:hypothetical protein